MRKICASVASDPPHASSLPSGLTAVVCMPDPFGPEALKTPWPGLSIPAGRGCRACAGGRATLVPERASTSRRRSWLHLVPTTAWRPSSQACCCCWEREEKEREGREGEVEREMERAKEKKRESEGEEKGERRRRKGRAKEKKRESEE